MLHERSGIERDILLALDAVPSRIPVVLGPSGCGRTSVLRRIGIRLGSALGRYVDAERVLSTPERFLAAVVGPVEDRGAATIPADTPRAALDALMAYIDQPAFPSGRQQPVLLLDEFVELERLSAFPGLRGLLDRFLEAVAHSPNRFVLASRYVTRATRLLASFPSDRFAVVELPPLTENEVRTVLAGQVAGYDDADVAEMAGLVQALTDGRPGYVQHIVAALAADEDARDPVNALTESLSSGAPLAAALRFTYELRLHRARGYSALKGVLATLADQEPLTLSGIAKRLGRTPGSTKDYLSWLMDVDLVRVEAKRYRFVDPLLRLWVRLHCRPVPPDDIALAREVQDYAVSRHPPAGDVTEDARALPAAAKSASVPEPLIDLIEID